VELGLYLWNHLRLTSRCYQARNQGFLIRSSTICQTEKIMQMHGMRAPRGGYTRSDTAAWTQSEEEPADPEGWSVGANVGGNTRGGGINWSVGATYSWDDSEQRYRYNGPDISRRLKWRPSALSEEEPADPEGWSVTGNVGGNTRGGGVNWNVGATYSWDDSEQRYRYGDKRDYGIQKGPVYQTRPYFPGRKGAVFPRVMSDSKNKFNPGYIQPVRW
jgi:hypothetical protein